jgi:hypothetical protein
MAPCASGRGPHPRNEGVGDGAVINVTGDGYEEGGNTYAEIETNHSFALLVEERRQRMCGRVGFPDGDSAT